MAELTDAKIKFVGVLRLAGIIHPHAGQEQVVLDALDVYERDITAAPEHDGLPTAEDLDAVAAEEAARQATRGAALAAEDGPVEIEHEGYAVDDSAAQAETAAGPAETEEPVAETEQDETEQPVSQVEEVADGD